MKTIWIDEGAETGATYYESKNDILNHIRSILKEDKDMMDARGYTSINDVSDDDLFEIAHYHYSIYNYEFINFNFKILNTMEHIFSINAIELASELADEKVKQQFPNGEYINFDEYTKTYTYIDQAQDLFNQYYDEYLTKIENTKESNSIFKQLTETNIMLDEWYKCLPLKALCTIHSIDFFSISKDEIRELLDECYVDWSDLPIEERADIYDSLKEEYKSFTNHIKI